MAPKITTWIKKATTIHIKVEALDNSLSILAGLDLGPAGVIFLFIGYLFWGYCFRIS